LVILIENEIWSKKLMDILGLYTLPVAVKIIKTEDPLPDIELPAQNSRYCQLLMLAKKGQTFMIDA